MPLPPRQRAPRSASMGAQDDALASLLSEEHGIDPAVNDAFDRICRKAIDAGHASDDFAMLHRFMRT